jgi:hypothetical protein
LESQVTVELPISDVKVIGTTAINKAETANDKEIKELKENGEDSKL